jgi:hypothetical protein
MGYHLAIDTVLTESCLYLIIYLVGRFRGSHECRSGVLDIVANLWHISALSSHMLGTALGPQALLRGLHGHVLAPLGGATVVHLGVFIRAKTVTVLIRCLGVLELEHLADYVHYLLLVRLDLLHQGHLETFGILDALRLQHCLGILLLELD